MKSFNKAVLAVASVAALSFLIAARQPSDGYGRGVSGMQGMQDRQGMPMNSMMQMCRQKMQSMVRSDDQVKKDIEAAKQSNVSSKKHAALDEAEKALDSVPSHISNCMNMMSNMRKMRSRGGGMCGGMMSGQ